MFKSGVQDLIGIVISTFMHQPYIDADDSPPRTISGILCRSLSKRQPLLAANVFALRGVEPEPAMPLYNVSFQCDDCGVEHPLLLTVYLVESVDKASIAELFRGRALPPQISALLNRKAICLKTGKRLSVDKEDQLLLSRASLSG